MLISKKKLAKLLRESYNKGLNDGYDLGIWMGVVGPSKGAVLSGSLKK